MDTEPEKIIKFVVNSKNITNKNNLAWRKSEADPLRKECVTVIPAAAMSGIRYKHCYSGLLQITMSQHFQIYSYGLTDVESFLLSARAQAIKAK